MKRYSLFLLFLLFSMSANLLGFKLVGLVPVRNEQLLISQCLKALSKYTDAIVVLDDASTDDTVAVVKHVAQECTVKKIIRKKKVVSG